MSSRDEILNKLRSAPRPFPGYRDSHYSRIPTVPVPKNLDLIERFIKEAEALTCVIHDVPDSAHGIGVIQELIGEDRAIQCWGFEHIPLKGLEEALADSGVSVSAPFDGTCRVGITGADYGLSATGSLVFHAQEGQIRNASLLPFLHIAVLRKDRIITDFEAWVALQREDGLCLFEQSSNVFLVSGSSRTADIGKILILGAHGPAELHIILVDEGAYDQ